MLRGFKVNGILKFSKKEELELIFAQYGEIESTVIVINHFDDLYENYGYVFYKDSESAKRAYAALKNNFMLVDGTIMKLKWRSDEYKVGKKDRVDLHFLNQVSS